MNKPRRLKNIEKHLKENNLEKIKILMNRLHPSDSGIIIRFLADQEVRILFDTVEDRKAGQIFEELEYEHQRKLLETLGREKSAAIMQYMRADKLADLLARLDPELFSEYRQLMRSPEAIEAYQLMTYPKESAGGIMSKDYCVVFTNDSLGQVLKKLRQYYAHIDNRKASYVYVIDDDKNLVGVLQMRDLVVNDPHIIVNDVMRTSLITVSPDLDQESAAHLFRKYNLLALPVIDKDKKFLGIISSDDIMDIIEREASEDMLKMSGIEGGDETHRTPIAQVIKKRLHWLSINVLLNVVSASVIAMYQNTLQAVVVLAVFLPIISDMSGCSGMQAVVVSVRELAMNKITPGGFRRVLRRELVIGMLNGFVLGAEIGLIAYFWKGMVMLGAVVALALWINTVIAVCIGGALPLIIKKFKLDPAVASGPVLTTITDMMGFFLVLSLATRFLC